MWLVGFRDLQWRRKRFVIAVLATALLFSVTLLLSGITAFFHNEVQRTMRELDVDTWIVPVGVTGPFTSPNLFPAGVARQIAAIPGVTRADPIVLFQETVTSRTPRDLNVIGYTLGGVGQPHVTQGRLPNASGEIVVDRSFGRRIGQTITLGRRSFRVVGTVSGITYFGGIPVAFVSKADAQEVLLGGASLATAIVTRGKPTGPLPLGYVEASNAAVRADLARPVSMAGKTIGFLDLLLWLIAAGIIAAILYMSALERAKEFAVVKAMGAANRFVVIGIAFQAVVLSIAAALVAFVLARLLVPTFPIAVEIPTRAYVELSVVSVTVGLLGSLTGLRRVLTIDPAAAFGGA